MLSVNKALVGKRVYRGASQSPNKGQVSAKGAQGYLQRELRNKAALRNKRQRGAMMGNPKGRDGKSDMRSGVASMALNRAMVGSGNTTDIMGPRGPKQGSIRDSPGSRNWGPDDGRPVVNQGKGGIGDIRHWGSDDGRPVLGGGGKPAGQQPPQVQVNDQGLLELPYNNDFAMEQYNALNDANSQLLGLKAEGDQQALEYQQGRREADLGYGQMQRSTLNENAARGTAFSSAYGTAAAGNANAYANQVGALDSQNAAFQNNQAMQRAAIQNALNQQLQLATLGYGNSLAEQAGSLGFGNANAPVNPSKSGTRPKRKNTQRNRRKSIKRRGRDGKRN